VSSEEIAPEGAQYSGRYRARAVAQVYQRSHPDGAFVDPPQVMMQEPGRSFTRRQWEAVKRAVDEAFEAFEAKWPSP
jgi:hypothetical protein